MKKSVLSVLVIGLLVACQQKPKQLEAKAYQTSAAGDKMTLVATSELEPEVELIINPEVEFQTILGFGGAFTESSAYLLNQMSKGKRTEILQAYFGPEGANYSFTRTHMNSCDFSLGQYSYAPVAGDMVLDHFSIDEDRDDIIPMIKDAQRISQNGFKILASPWTAPPWMKDNNHWVGGKLLPKYYDTWALFFSKYADAYKAEGIDIWGFTVENEPHGNDNNWESMHFTPEEMTDFVTNHLGPKLEKHGKGDLVVLGFDQNRDGIREWADVMYRDETSRRYYDGMAIHWYESTFRYFPEELQYAHRAAPDKYLIQTEACVDAEVPHWQDDAWYWKKEATDWGWDSASEDKKHLHPKYVPVYRYARDIIGCLNNWVEGWIDWNMVLDTQGGPNWVENWCVAPVIVNPETDEVYYTPLYHTMAHFSKYIRPGAKRIGIDNAPEELMITACKNPDGSIAAIVLNMNESRKTFGLNLHGEKVAFTIDARAIQTIIIP
jgi:glucosylceramidase